MPTHQLHIIWQLNTIILDDIVSLFTYVFCVSSAISNCDFTTRKGTISKWVIRSKLLHNVDYYIISVFCLSVSRYLRKRKFHSHWVADISKFHLSLIWSGREADHIRDKWNFDISATQWHLMVILTLEFSFYLWQTA